MNANIYKYSKDNAIAFLLLVVISTVVIFTPAFTIQYIGLDLAFSFVFITEILILIDTYKAKYKEKINQLETEFKNL